MLLIVVVSTSKILSISSLPTILPITPRLFTGVGPILIKSPRFKSLILPKTLITASHSSGWGTLVNSILAIALTYLGQRLNVDIYLAAVVVFVGRMFNNLGAIRRYYVEKISSGKVIAKAEAVIKQVNEENNDKNIE